MASKLGPLAKLLVNVAASEVGGAESTQSSSTESTSEESSQSQKSEGILTQAGGGASENSEDDIPLGQQKEIVDAGSSSSSKDNEKSKKGGRGAKEGEGDGDEAQERNAKKQSSGGAHGGQLVDGSSGRGGEDQEKDMAREKEEKKKEQKKKKKKKKEKEKRSGAVCTAEPTPKRRKASAGVEPGGHGGAATTGVLELPDGSFAWDEVITNAVSALEKNARNCWKKVAKSLKQAFPTPEEAFKKKKEIRTAITRGLSFRDQQVLERGTESIGADGTPLSPEQTAHNENLKKVRRKENTYFSRLFEYGYQVEYGFNGPKRKRGKRKAPGGALAVTTPPAKAAGDEAPAAAQDGDRDHDALPQDHTELDNSAENGSEGKGELQPPSTGAGSEHREPPPTHVLPQPATATNPSDGAQNGPGLEFNAEDGGHHHHHHRESNDAEAKSPMVSAGHPATAAAVSPAASGLASSAESPTTAAVSPEHGPADGAELPLERPVVYILELEGGNYYVGRSTNRFQRAEAHRSMEAHMGAAWTREHKPIAGVKEVYFYIGDVRFGGLEEDYYTLKMMALHGIDKVRGGSFCDVQFNNYVKSHIRKMLDHNEGRCLSCNRIGHSSKRCPRRISGSSPLRRDAPLTTTSPFKATVSSAMNAEVVTSGTDQDA